MGNFAVDHVQRQEVIEAGGVITILFGPPTPGTLSVLLFAEGGLSAKLLPSRPEPIRPPTVASVARPGIGPRAGLSPSIARMQMDSFVTTGPGSLGIFDPGGGTDPPPPPPPPISSDVFRVEVLNAGGAVRATQMGPLTFEVPPEAGPGVAQFGPPSKWSVRVTNTSRSRAFTTINLLFRGQRPILSREIDLDFINEKLDLIFNVPQPFQIAFRNREVARVNNVPINHSFVMLNSSAGWRELHPDLADHEKDLGARVFSEGFQSHTITVKATVHDGSLAFHARVAFPWSPANIEVLNVIRAVAGDVIGAIGDAFFSLTPFDRPEVSIKDLVVDVFLVLRPQGIHLRPAPTFEVIARPRVVLDPSWAGEVVAVLLKLAFERLLPEVMSEAFRTNAASLLAWLIGDRGREVTGNDETLTLQYAGDPPRPVDTSVVGTVATPVGPLTPGNLSKIDHIVVVMMENRSFDHMLGFLSLPTSGNGGRIGLGRGDVNGLRGNETNPRNTRGAQQRVFSLATPWLPNERPRPDRETRGTKFRFDPNHGYEETLAQRGGYDLFLPTIFGGPPRLFRVGENEGFVLDFARVLSGIDNAAEELLLRGEVMGYHPAEHVPMYRFLAEEYAVCDRWFASHPGNTWPNRFVSLTGRLAIGANGIAQVDNPPLETFDPLDTATIFDHLTAAGVDWRYYEQDFCMLRLFSKYTFDTQQVVALNDPDDGFFALVRAGRLPPVVYIEPDLTDIPPGSDDHPPSDITAGQAFIRRIFEALAEGPPEQWRKTLLIVTYDEHGGFYDHVYPESKHLFNPQSPEEGGFASLGIDPETAKPIDHYGMRVPAFVVSPWVPAASVGVDEYDHTSILKTIIARFVPHQPPNMGQRVALAKDVGPLLSLTTPRGPRRPPFVDFRLEGHDAVAMTRSLGPPENDFRSFLSAMRTRIRGGSLSRVPDGTSKL